MPNALDLLKTRRSVKPMEMTGPAPSSAEIDTLLTVASRVPDHGKLTPWRFVLFEGAARAEIGEVFAKRWKVLHPDHGEESVAFQRGLFLRAPVVIAVVSTASPHVKIPEWEQLLSSAAVCYSIVLAATAMGFDAQWQTDWVAYDAATNAAMGLKGTERVSGIICIGTTTVPLEDRPRPDPQALLTRWGQA